MAPSFIRSSRCCRTPLGNDPRSQSWASVPKYLVSEFIAQPPCFGRIGGVAKTLGQIEELLLLGFLRLDLLFWQTNAPSHGFHFTLAPAGGARLPSRKSRLRSGALEFRRPSRRRASCGLRRCVFAAPRPSDSASPERRRAPARPWQPSSWPSAWLRI